MIGALGGSYLWSLRSGPWNLGVFLWVLCGFSEPSEPRDRLGTGGREIDFGPSARGGVACKIILRLEKEFTVLATSEE
jgi:hypothetical protein